MMEKTYDPRLIEDSIYRFWLDGNTFRSEPDPEREKFSIVIPPPNVTGALHVGHALDLSLQDLITRWQRMLGKNALWVPGTDHAGIGTQIVVERELAKEGKTRQQMGRDAFEKRVWEWKEYSHSQIVHRIYKLGSSCDWSRERFTMDEGLSHAVRTAFVRLYRDGLIYKGEYIVNWCPRCKTAISDLEVRHEQKEGYLYTIRYPLRGTDQFITVATTRPETMLGDTAVAVHPEDPRYKDLVGKIAVLPLLKREIPVIADAFVDREFGTGAVKLTPAHDPNDFLAGQRNGLPSVLVIDGDGNMTAKAGPYTGLDRFEARKRVVEDLMAEGLLVRQEKHVYAVGHCDRCKTVVEPLLSKQWFLRMESLAAPAIRVVEQGTLRFFPENWSRTYFEWMRNIHDWCISRQLWWGHRIPAWHCGACNAVLVDVEPPEKCAQCGSTDLLQETDVLDTWFSAALWPFSVFGWPEQTPELKYYYPTDLLVTGFDIIFFWVARMIMFGLKFMGDIPFRHAYIHGLVRDEHGQKMSKSRGNTIDPMDLIAEYGADAMRFTLAALSSPTPDIPLAPKRIQGYKAFINKIWNSVRFSLLKVGDTEDLTPLPEAEWDLGDRWIASRLNRAAGEINAALAEYRFDLASNAAYQFLWREFCDWYVEWIKPHLNEDQPHASAKKGLLLQRVSEILRLLHPFLPFVTEHLWQQIPDRARTGRMIMTASYPVRNDQLISETAEADFGFLMDLIGKVRQVRTEMNIEPARKVRVLVKAGERRPLMEEQLGQILLFIRGESLEFVTEFPPELRLARGMVAGCEVAIDLAGALDLHAEKERLHKDLKKIETELTQSEKKLANENFVRNAPAEVVTEQRTRQQDLALRKQKTLEHLHSLGG